MRSLISFSGPLFYLVSNPLTPFPKHPHRLLGRSSIPDKYYPVSNSFTPEFPKHPHPLLGRQTSTFPFGTTSMSPPSGWPQTSARMRRRKRNVPSGTTRTSTNSWSFLLPSSPKSPTSKVRLVPLHGPAPTTDSTHPVLTHTLRDALHHLRFCHPPIREHSLPNRRTIELLRLVHVAAGVRAHG